MHLYYLQCRRIPFHLFFLTHVSCLGYKLLCIINFLAFWSICLNSFLVHFKNGPEYLTSGTALVFILVVELGFKKLSGSSERLFLNFFFLLRLFYEVRFQYSQLLVLVLFSKRFNFSWFGNSVISVVFLFFSLWAQHIFLSQIPFVYPGFIFLLFLLVPIFFSFLFHLFLFFFFFGGGKQLNVVHVLKVINFFL